MTDPQPQNSKEPQSQNSPQDQSSTQNAQSPQSEPKDPSSNISFLGKIKKSISKQIIIPIIVVIAIVGAGGIYLWMSTKAGSIQNLPTPATTKALLEINAPIDQEATTEAEITVSGKTNPNSLVSATTQGGEEIYESDENGNYSGTFILEEGPNEITFTAFGNNDEETTATRSVVFVREEEL